MAATATDTTAPQTVAPSGKIPGDAPGGAMLEIAGLNVSYPVYEEEPVRACGTST